MRDAMMEQLGELRVEPTAKRIRATLGGQTVLDSERALLVWEPKRVVPSYAVPAADVVAELIASDGSGDAGPSATPAPRAPELEGRPVYDPSIPFAVHTTEGNALALRIDGDVRPDIAFQPTDPALEGYVILDFRAFDAWYEEDEINVGHPRDPFHRIDIVHSSRHVRVELDGVLLAETRTPITLFEPPLPVRYYLPVEDIVPGVLRPSETRSTCAYKGQATYWSAGDAEDVAWTYPAPLREAGQVAGRVAFFNERVDLIVDGVPLERVITPWSRRQP